MTDKEKDRDEKILSVFKEGKIKTWTEIKEETGFSDRKVTDGLKSLIKRGQLIHLEEHKWYIRSCDIQKLKNLARDYFIRRDHTKDLRPVFQSIREKTLDENELFAPPRYRPDWEHRYRIGRILDEEEKLMLQHLNHHIPEFIERYHKYYRRMCKRNNKGRGLIDKLGEEIANDLAIKYSPIPLNPDECGMEYIFPQEVIQSLFELETEKLRVKEKKGENFDFRNHPAFLKSMAPGSIQEDKKTFNGERIVHFVYTKGKDTPIFSFTKLTGKKDEYEEELNEYFEQKMKKVFSPGSAYRKGVREYLHITNELDELRDELIGQCRDYANQNILPGVCFDIKRSLAELKESES